MEQNINAENNKVSEQELMDFFIDYLYNDIHKIYSSDKLDDISDKTLDDISDETMESFTKFSKMHLEVYGYKPVKPSSNKCLQKVYKEMDAIEHELVEFGSLMRECQEYVKQVGQDFLSPEKYESCLSQGSVDMQISRMRDIYDIIPRYAKQGFCTPNDLNAIEFALSEAKYRYSSLITNNILTDEIARENLFTNCAFHLDRPNVELYLTLNEDGEREVFRRSCLEKLTGRSFEDIRSLKIKVKNEDPLEIKFYSYYQDDTARIVVTLRDRDPLTNKQKPPVSREILLSKEEQSILNRIVESKIGSVEDRIACVIHNGVDFEPVADLRTLECKDGHVRVQLRFPKNGDLKDVLFRSNISKINGIETVEEFNKKGYYVEADASLDGNGEMSLRVFIRNDREKTKLPVPFKDIEKAIVLNGPGIKMLLDNEKIKQEKRKAMNRVGHPKRS